MAVYFLRHGESDANVANLFAGQKEDSRLTARGAEQANIAGHELSKAGIRRIISSKLIRAHETARIVGGIIGVSSIELDDRLLEYDMGSLTGTPHREVTSQELVDAIDAEGAIEFQTRVLSLLREVKVINQNILLVSHAGVGRTIEAAQQGLPPEAFYDLPSYPNAHAVKLDLNWLG